MTKRTNESIPLAPGYGLTVDGKILIFTQIDWEKRQGMFRFFNTAEEADDWSHAASLRQMPKWHAENCPRCKQSCGETKL